MKREINTLVLTTLILLALGALMIYSIGGLRTGAAGRILPKHMIFLVVGLMGFVVMINFDYHILSNKIIRRCFFVGTLILIILPFVPGIGVEMGEARRWIGRQSLSFQPSELARFTLVLILSFQLTKHQENLHKITHSIIMPVLILLLYGGIVFFQKDMGIPFIMAVTTMVLLWNARVKIIYLIFTGVAGAAALPFLIRSQGYRSSRIQVLMNPWISRDDRGYQLIQSLSAFYQGGFSGSGVGYGEQKLGYLPAAHTDFIFAMIGEELGLIGTIFVIVLFTVLLIAGIRVVLGAPDLFGSLLASGITTLIVFQAFFVMLVNLGFLPTKGLPLPLVSYGGSSLVINLWMMGILVNIARQAQLSETPVKKDITVSLWKRPLFWIFQPRPLKIT